jgi:uncharacterized protein YheU (UPF0270 family)
MRGNGLHEGEGGIDCGAADLDRDDRVQQATGSLEGGEIVVLIREDTEHARVDTQTHAAVDVLLRGLEPRVCLRLLVDEVQKPDAG